jgi:hypothetical protein
MPVLLGTALMATQLVAQNSPLQSGNNLIQPIDVPPNLAIFFQTMGSRMTAPTMATVTFIGTTTDSKGSRSAQIVVQAPGYMSYREGVTRAVTFDGSQNKTNNAASADDDERVSESFLAHLPDALFLQIGAGGTLRRVGSHFRTDNSKSKSYTGPLLTVYAFSPRNRPGLSRGKPFQQELFICIDERTGLVSEVRMTTSAGAKQQIIIQTQFTGWTQQSGQWFPGKIVRLENGSQALSFSVAQAALGSALPTSSFQP